MRRWLLASASYLILLTLPVWAQHHASWLAGSSGGVAAHFSGSMLAGTPSHNFGSGRSGSFRGYSRSNFGSSHALAGHSGGSFRGARTDFDHRGFHHHREGFRNRYFYPYGIYYPYYSWYLDPYYLSDYRESPYQYQNEDDNANGDSARYYPAPPREDSGVHRDVEALNGKIDRLAADLEARNQPKPLQEVTTALVFRDQHVLEVRNYAISGGTLWVLNDKAAKKIPLAQLDLDATIKMNDDRGVDFQVPK
jgi:hypothetical protein